MFLANTSHVSAALLSRSESVMPALDRLKAVDALYPHEKREALFRCWLAVTVVVLAALPRLDRAYLSET